MPRRAAAVALVAALGLVAVVVAVALASDGDDPASSPGAKALAAALADASPASAPFTGLTEVRAAIGGRCLRLAVADTEAERVAGLRGNSSDLGGYDGMLFRFTEPSDVGFTMSDVPDPLAIAFFEANGLRDSTRAMKPCPDKAEADCPVYRADGPFTFAVETKPGDLPPGPLTACSS